MRTTVTLDPDVVARLNALMRERGTSFKQTLNDAIRAGTSVAHRPAERYRLKPERMELRPGINLDKALQLAAEIEDDGIVRKLELGK